MGLDLVHLKATLQPENPEEAYRFSEEDFDEHALDVLGFRKFIQVIPDSDYPTRIVIVKDEEALGVLRANGRDEAMDKDGVSILLGETADLAQRVEQIEAANGWSAAEREIYMSTQWVAKGIHIGYGHGWSRRLQPLREWTWGTTDAVRKELKQRPPDSLPPIQVLRISYRVPADYHGLYAEEVGYQRKGMTQGFYDEFGSPRPYVLRSDVLRAARFLELSSTPEKDDERRAYFQDQFIAGFEEGASIFHVSY